MANQEHLDILKQGVDVWNQWRKEHSTERPDLSGADLSEVDLSNATLSGAELSKVNFRNANLYKADLSETNLSEANLHGTNFSHANLSGATLRGADLTKARLVDANLQGALLKDCSIYGISVWNVQLEGAEQQNLMINYRDEPIITVDNLKIAQFIYLLLKNEEIRDFLNTITSKAVLILGRFTSQRKPILDALRDALRARDYVPILFDFEKPSSRDLAETVSTLAHLARFIIADLTDPSSIPLELREIIPNLATPVQPILLAGMREFSMFVTLRKYPWVLPTYFYTDEVSLLQSLKEKVIAPAEQKAKELSQT